MTSPFMEIITEEQHSLPLVDTQVVVRSGALADEPGCEGATRHAIELMARGAGSRSHAEIDEAFDCLGASLGMHVGHDTVTFSMRCLDRNLDDALAIVSDIILRPTFPKDEHEKLLRESLSVLDEVREDDSSLCARHFQRYVLPDHPYGRTVLGTSDSLNKLTPAHAADFVDTHLVQDNMLIGYAGAVTDARARDLSLAHFAEIANRRPPPAPRLPTPRYANGRRTYLIDKPERTQSQILIGHPGPSRADPQWLALYMAATIFGGTFTSRLTTEVRVKRGWSYGADCRLSRSRGARSFRIRVFPDADKTRDTLELVFDLWKQIIADGVTSKELEFAQDYVAGGWPFNFDTVEKRLDRRLDVKLLGLPDDEYDTFVERARALSVDEVNDVMRLWWQPHNAVTVLTATADTMRARLGGLDVGDIEIVPHDAY